MSTVFLDGLYTRLEMVMPVCTFGPAVFAFPHSRAGRANVPFRGHFAAVLISPINKDLKGAFKGKLTSAMCSAIIAGLFVRLQQILWKPQSEPAGHLLPVVKLYGQTCVSGLSRLKLAVYPNLVDNPEAAAAKPVRSWCEKVEGIVVRV